MHWLAYLYCPSRPRRHLANASIYYPHVELSRVRLTPFLVHLLLNQIVARTPARFLIQRCAYSDDQVESNPFPGSLPDAILQCHATGVRVKA